MNKIFVKISCLAFCVMLILNCVMFVSASDPSYTITAEVPETAKAGDSLTVNINISSAGTYGGNFTLVYDNSLLSPISAEKGGLVESEGLISSVNENHGDNSIRVSWAGAAEITAPGCICTCSFKCLSEGTALFSFKDANIFYGDGTAAEPVLISGDTAVEASEAAEETTEPSTEQPGESVLISLSAPESCKRASSIDTAIVMAEDSLAFGGNAVIEYDSTLFKVKNFTPGGDLSENTVISFNSDYSENSVKLSWAGDREYTEETELAVITFEALEQKGSGEFNISSAMLCDGDGNPVECYTSGAETAVKNYTGDADGSGDVNLLDAIAVLKYDENAEKAVSECDAADTDGDGFITSDDAANILKYASGLITEFPAEEVS